MKIHENRNKQVHSKSTCGYCREEGHNQYQCSHVAEDWKELSRYRIPLNEDGVPLRRGWHGQSYTGTNPLKATVYNNLFSSWFNACQKAMNGQIERKALAKQKKTGASRTCGYCGSTSHTRKNCDDMKQFLKDCYKANENWRKKAYEQLVEHYGLSVGACVHVTLRHSFGVPAKDSLGIVTSINWETLNLFASCKQKSSFAYSPLEITVLVDGHSLIISNTDEFFGLIEANGKTNRWYESCKLNRIVTPAKEKLPPSWITDYKESFETLVGKKSKIILQNGMASEYRSPNLYQHVQQWKQ